MLNITIGPFEPRDWSQLTALLTRHNLPLDGLDAHTDATLVARQGDSVVGSAALELYGAYALLRSVAVAPEQQGQGIAARLLDAVETRARQHGVRALYLLTETAAPYFARRGFAPIARDEVDPAVTASVEFTNACPASAQAMRLNLHA